MNRT
jgi:hypothetical protein